MTAKLLRITLRSSLYRSVALPRLSRSLATSSSSSSSSFTRPSPPPLPPKEQREFEELIRKSSAPLSRSTSPDDRGGQPEGLVDVDEVHHPDYRARPKAEFEGEVNPRTGESGGPKREPLVHGDWAYGGKVTDF
ncbi:hypothetical protein JCM11641_003435 [Rhodosporidiobolus odoratus]